MSIITQNNHMAVTYVLLNVSLGLLGSMCSMDSVEGVDQRSVSD